MNAIILSSRKRETDKATPVKVWGFIDYSKIQETINCKPMIPKKLSQSMQKIH
jgi:hypothetical protein